jgi:hypothetical protein
VQILSEQLILNLHMRHLLPTLILILLCVGCSIEKFDKRATLVTAISPTNQTPNESGLIQSLQQDPSIKTIDCPRRNLDLSTRIKNNAVKQLLYSVAGSGRGVFKAKKTCITVEGDPVTEYMIVVSGKIRVIHDASQDRFGGMDVHSYDVNNIQIGYYDKDMNFLPLVGKSPKDKELFIQYSLPENGKGRF